MKSSRIFAATFENVTIGTAVQSIMEVQVPDNTLIEVLRAWLSPAIGTPVDEVLAINLYSNNDAATGGAGMVEQPLSPTALADPSNCTALLEPTQGASPLLIYDDAYHLQNGWLYPPVPDEMEEIFGGNLDPGDVVGLELAVASTATPAISGGIRWREISVA